MSKDSNTSKKRLRGDDSEIGDSNTDKFRIMTVKQLRQEATLLGISTSGSKKELIDRLVSKSKDIVIDGNEEKDVNKSKEEKLVTAIKKGAALLDQWLPDEIKSQYHVLQRGDEIYNAMLNQTNVGDNNNKFYVIQVLESDDGGKLMVYSRWGRVGVKGQDKLNGPYKSPESAIQEFEQKFYAKTKNQWSNRKEFVCHPKCYAWLEMDYTETERVFVCVSTTGTYKRNLHLFHPSMMQRFLLEVLVEKPGGESLVGSIKIAVLPIAKVFTMCFLGFLMASKYVNILSASGRKLLNGLVFSLLLPCLIFSQLGQAITWEKMLEWWFIPVNVVIAAISGSLIGLLVASIVRPPYPYFKFTIIQIGIGNIGNVPLVLIAALCRDKSNPFGDSDKCAQDGNAYISFGQWVGAIILYTYVFNMLAPPPEGSFDVEESSPPLKRSTKDSSPEQIPLLIEESEPTDSSAPTKGKIRSLLKFLYEKLKLKQILQPPIIASILAMGIGSVPFLRGLIFTPEAPLYFFTDSCLILGEAMIPCILLALGGNLVDGPGSSKLGLKTTAAIVFGRLVLVPPTGLGIVMLADKLGFLPPGDKMFRFVLLLQHTMPTSVLAGAVANLRGCGREAAAILFWVHIFAVFSMAGWIVLYLNLLF